MSEVWNGAAGLRKHLVAVEAIRPHPENPRRGEIQAIAGSLERFGQVRLVLLDNEGNVVAGNHTYLAARELGWTHVAAVVGEFADAAEARAYLLADNRLAELGDYEQSELLALLETVEGTGSWAGTGYASDDLEDLRYLLDRVQTTAPEAFRGGYSDDGDLAERLAQVGTQAQKKEVVLALARERHAQFGIYVRMIQKERGSEGVADTVLAAVRSQAELANQG